MHRSRNICYFSAQRLLKLAAPPPPRTLLHCKGRSHTSLGIEGSSLSICHQRRYNTAAPKSFYHNEVLDRYVEQSVNPNTVRQLVFFGRHMTDDRLIKSANYVRKEITIRLAHRIRDFQKLPFIVGTNPHIEVSI